MPPWFREVKSYVPFPNSLVDVSIWISVIDFYVCIYLGCIYGSVIFLLSFAKMFDLFLSTSQQSKVAGSISRTRICI